MSYIQKVKIVITAIMVLTFAGAFGALALATKDYDPDSYLGVHSPNWKP